MSKEILDKLSAVERIQERLLTSQEHQTIILNKHSELLEDMGKTLVRNTAIVDEHHKRSLYLENRQNTLETIIQKIMGHVNRVEGIGLFFKWMTIVGGAIGMIYSVIHFLIIR